MLERGIIAASTILFLATSLFAQAPPGSSPDPNTSPTPASSTPAPEKTSEPSAQNASAPPNSTEPTPLPLFRATSRLVTVDVIVADGKGQPIKDLKAEDFTLLEDGKPQKVRFFEMHFAPPQKSGPEPVPVRLPEHQYTNFPQAAPNSGITIILLDMLNTPSPDQGYARNQMLQFLKKLPTQQPVALFTLSESLRMQQGFTSDSDALIAAATKLLAHQSPLLTTENERQEEEDDIERAARMSEPGRSNAPMISLLATSLEHALDMREGWAQDSRAQSTLDALAAVARVLAGYPGRKNLIWLSGNFPFRFGPDPSNDPIHNPSIYVNKIRETVASLSASQVAVYPIDVSGLGVIGIPASSNGEGIGSVGTSTAAADSAIRTRESTALWETHDTMTDIARQTGGEAFYGTNDLQTAISRSFSHSTNYYSLAYVPENRNWNGHYRKLEVKVAAKGLKLDYRRGYYAVPIREIQVDQAKRLLLSAMLPALPEYTMLLLKVQILPPDHDHPAVSIDYAVAPDDLTFGDLAAGKRHVVVDFAAMAWDKDGRQVAQVGNTLDGTLDANAYSAIQQSGLPEHQELKLRPGTYHLRLGAIDRGNQKIGTVDALLTVPN